MRVKNIRADPSHPCRSVFYSGFQGEARLRGLTQNNYSTTIISVYAPRLRASA